MRSDRHSRLGSRASGCISGVVCVLVMAGCAAIERASRHQAPPVAAPPAATVPAESRDAASAQSAEPPQATRMERATVAAEPKVPRATTTPRAAATISGSASQGAAKPAASTPRPPASPAPAASTPKAPALPAPAPQTPKRETPAPALARPQAPPPLDLKSLETRLKETKAIGVLTKLTLKNQIDDLLDRFRAFYRGRLQTTLADLRRSYDLLFLKVLALLQDADPPLASAIAASRESIWAIVSDPEKLSAR